MAPLPENGNGVQQISVPFLLSEPAGTPDHNAPRILQKQGIGWRSIELLKIQTVVDDKGFVDGNQGSVFGQDHAPGMFRIAEQFCQDMPEEKPVQDSVFRRQGESPPEDYISGAGKSRSKPSAFEIRRQGQDYTLDPISPQKICDTGQLEWIEKTEVRNRYTQYGNSGTCGQPVAKYGGNVRHCAHAPAPLGEQQGVGVIPLFSPAPGTICINKTYGSLHHYLPGEAVNIGVRIPAARHERI